MSQRFVTCFTPAVQLRTECDDRIADKLAHAGNRKGVSCAVRFLAHLELPLSNFRLRY